MYTKNFDYETYVIQAAGGSETAFRKLYEQTYHFILKICQKNIMDARNAEDMLQETYIKAYQHLSQLKDPHMFPSWLSRIAKNTCYRYDEKITDKENERWENFVSGPNDDSDTNVGIWDVAIEEDVTPSLDDEFVYDSMLNILSEEERTCLLLTYEGYKENEISQMMTIPKGTVKSRKHYARKKMKEELEKYNES